MEFFFFFSLTEWNYFLKTYTAYTFITQVLITNYWYLYESCQMLRWWKNAFSGNEKWKWAGLSIEREKQKHKINNFHQANKTNWRNSLSKLLFVILALHLLPFPCVLPGVLLIFVGIHLLTSPCIPDYTHHWCCKPSYLWIR